ncbi:hypothetical protein MKO06_03815 [Gramella sp. GC03-9]|uniref:Uncharacterized protein n=1 Tax=Christiangramia oceanisediminis TaxID=2920386 RepID=A0A9X2KXB6_9FLAO|nr:hypothetical protein [Gramella oceanisediminis]MCP9199021.1 hypothetical protein [Gramella oceanisediminis]
MFRILSIFVFSLSWIIGFSQTNNNVDIELLKKLTLEDISYSINAQSDSGRVLFGLSCNQETWGECTAFAYKQFGGSWILKDTLTIPNFQGQIENLSYDNQVIYFGSLSAGGSSGNGSYYFNAYSLDENKFYSLEYWWSDFKYSNYGFSNLEEITNIEILNILEKNVEISDYVYKPSGELSLQDHWKIDNKNIYEEIFKDEIKVIFKYKKDIPLDSEEKVAENDNFILYNVFKGNLYGFDKNMKKYFLIWVPNWSYDTTRFIDLDGNDVSIIDSTLGDNGAQIYIDLESKEIFGVYNRISEK